MELEPPPPPNFRSPAWGWTKATRALTLLVLVFALYLIVGETPATHGAVYDDDGFDAIDDFRGAVLDGGSGKAALTVYECTLDAHGCAPPCRAVVTAPGGVDSFAPRLRVAFAPRFCHQ